MSSVVCDSSELHGRGVFLVRDALAGEILDSGPVLLVPHVELESGLIGHYVFEHSKNEDALCLGHASMLNHSDAPNAQVAIDEEGLEYELTALHDIPAHTELLINYGPLYGF